MEIFTTQSRQAINKQNLDKAIINKEDSLEWSLQVSKKQTVYNTDNDKQKKIQAEKEKRNDYITKYTKYAIQSKLNSGSNQDEHTSSKKYSIDQGNNDVTHELNMESKKFKTKKALNGQVNYKDKKINNSMSNYKNEIEVDKYKKLEKPGNTISKIDFSQINENQLCDPNNSEKINNMKIQSKTDILDNEMNNQSKEHLPKLNIKLENQHSKIESPSMKELVSPNKFRDYYKQQGLFQSPRLINELSKQDHDRYKLIKHVGVLCSVVERYSNENQIEIQSCNTIKQYKTALNTKTSKKGLSLFCERRGVNGLSEIFRMSLSQSEL